ncbi:UPF0561 protein C2orf68 homolog [Lemmus lemmus]
MEAARDPGPGLCCKPGGRLDMSHGFVHHIRRNQIARYRPAPGPARPGSAGSAPRRDDYDKKFALTDGSAHLVNPDCEESSESSSTGSSELEPPGRQLFCLEYEADSGEVTSVIVYQDDDPTRVTEEVSAHSPLDPAMREALRLRVQEELAKRQSRH